MITMEKIIEESKRIVSDHHDDADPILSRYRDMRDFLESLGFEKIGEGSFKSAFTHPGGFPYVVKVVRYMQDDPERFHDCVHAKVEGLEEIFVIPIYRDSLIQVQARVEIPENGREVDDIVNFLEELVLEHRGYSADDAIWELPNELRPDIHWGNVGLIDGWPVCFDW